MLVYDKHVLGRQRKRRKFECFIGYKKMIGSEVRKVTYPEFCICFYHHYW